MAAVNIWSLRLCAKYGYQATRAVLDTAPSRLFQQSTRTVSANMAAGFDYQNSELQRFLDDVHDVIMSDVLVEGSKRDNKLVEFQQPRELEKLLDLEISGPTKHEDLLHLCKQVTKYSVKSVHPGFHNQLYGTINGYGLCGAWLTEALNTNIHTFESNPAFVLIENYMVQKLCELVGYRSGDGLFCPGGSFSNLMGINLARYKTFPEFKSQGMNGAKKMKIYTSEEAHYSVSKGAIFMGLGSNNVVKIKTDDRGKMILADLERRIQEDIQEGEVPFMVNATAGTTVLGAFDPLHDLADVCKRYNLWLHCDACLGGGALLSSQYKYLLDGIERTDSVAWNFHKMSGAPIQCSAFLVKQKGLLEEVNRTNAEYLFQPDKCYDTSYDIGDKTIQCGRKVDSMKLWLMWKALGDSGMAAHVENAFDNARYLTELLGGTDGFELVLPAYECANVSFWYVPPSLRNLPRNTAWWNKVGKVAPQIKERMLKAGSLMIGYQPLANRGLVNFFRIVVANGNNTRTDMDFVIREIDRLGNDL